MSASETSIEAARRHLSKGRCVIPNAKRAKKPSKGKGWQHERYVETNLSDFSDKNIGLLLGAESGGLVDVDLDCSEAIKIAATFLPPTNMRHGRRSTSRDSHWWYVVDEPPLAGTKFNDPTRTKEEDDKSTIVELRSGSGKSAAQTIIPPSVHPDTGEKLSWSADGDPARVEINALQTAVRKIAAAALLARFFPAQGSRHDFALALAGTLLRDPSWTDADASAFIRAVAEAGGSADPDARAAVVQTTRNRLDAKEPATGRTRLVEIIGENGKKVVGAVVKWLNLQMTQGTNHRRGNSLLCVVNALRENTENVLDGRRLEYDTMRTTPTLGRKALEDADVIKIRALMEERIPIAWDEDGRPKSWMTPSRDTIYDAVLTLASDSKFHAVREYLSALKWDGTPRIDRVTVEVFRAENTPVNRALLRRWFISAVARPMQPGCKVDTVLILVGAQGALKSTAFRVLAGEWFVDSAIDISNKDAKRTLQGTWILEWSELESLRRARDAEEVKAFLSSARDTFRPPYGRLDVQIDRTSVIVGSTNSDDFLTDASGNRRFWPLRVGEIDVDRLREWRDQLWAEAMALYAQGERWWLDDAEERALKGVHKEHEATDAWDEPIRTWLENPLPAGSFDARRRPIDPITTAEVLGHAINKQCANQTRADQMRVSNIMKRLGWTQHKVHGGVRVWTRPNQ